MRAQLVWACAWLAAVAALSAGSTFDADTGDAPALPQGGRARGVKVTFARVRPGDGPNEVSRRARLLSLAVERGETPTPLLPPGAFRATFETIVTLPARDRLRFRIDGRGRAQLRVNGDVVLDGALRTGRSLETEQPLRLKKGDNELVLVFESAAMGDGNVRLFWSGVDFGFEPIAPELMSHAADDPAVARGERLRRGHQLFVERRCARCHDYDQLRVGESAYGELDQAGPELRQVAARARQGFLAAWLADPRAIRPHGAMPRFPLTADDANDIAAWLGGLGTPAAAPGFDAQQVEAGQVRFRELGCIACHVDRREGAATAALGDRIALGFVAQKWHPAALVAYLRDPAAHHPDVRMPDLSLSQEDAEALAAWLLADGAPLPVPPGHPKRGRRLVQQHRCYLCHVLPDEVPPGDRVFPRYRNLDPDRGCLSADPLARGAPDHGLSPDDRDAVRAFLPFAADAPFRRAPLDFIARHFRADRCDACHALDGEPSTWARLVEPLSANAPLPPTQDPIAQGVPALTWVGAKLQPSWIRGFVLGEIASPRPWLTARMPAFRRHGDALAAGLVREHGYGAQDEPIRPGDAQLAIHGARLVAQGTGFGCVQCHALGDQPAVQVFEREGIELTTARGRLRHEYYTRWLADPTRLDPDSRMPKYADDKGKTAFTDVLGGDAAAQFEAIWQYLGGLARR